MSVPKNNRPIMIADGRDDKTPECRLWRAVIVSCWRDAFERADATLENSDTEPTKHVRTTPENIRGNARRWLCADIEPWKSDRIEVCDNADVSASTIQRIAIAHRESLAGRDVKRSAQEQALVEKRIAVRLEYLVSHADNHSAKVLDRLLGKLCELEDKRL